MSANDQSGNPPPDEQTKHPYNLRARGRPRNNAGRQDSQHIVPFHVPIRRTQTSDASGSDASSTDSDEEDFRQPKRRAGSAANNGPNMRQPIVLQTPEEHEYFQRLSPAERTAMANSMREVLALTPNTPLKFHVLRSGMSPHFKQIALQRLQQLRDGGQFSSDYGKLKNWVEALMQIPFGYNISLPYSLQHSGYEACSHFLERTKLQLDRACFGMQEPKMQVLQLVAQWVANNNCAGQILAFQGPPGVGKTNFVSNGLAPVLARPFAFISLGGATDSAYLRGHSYTYEGSTWGKIVDVLMKAKCMNPVFFFDEVDKISETPVGQEIVNVLIHLTDKTQNSHFTDRYFNDVEFDLGKALFVFSLNDESKVHPVLRDRMTIIRLPGYSVADKKAIARDHIIPKLLGQYGFTACQVMFTDDTLTHMVTAYSHDEQGVRSLIRSIDLILSRINVVRIACINAAFAQTHIPYNHMLTFPLSITPELVQRLMGTTLAGSNVDAMSDSVRMMYL